MMAMCKNCVHYEICEYSTVIDKEIKCRSFIPNEYYARVVRCKDCIHATINEHHPNRPLICCLTKMCGTTNSEWFCADGERRANDDS